MIFCLKNRDSEGRLKPANRNGEGLWSGEATRGGGFRVEETRVDVTIGDDAFINKGEVRKEKPIWMTESTVITGATVDGTSDGVVPGGATTAAAAAAAVAGLDQSRSATEKSKGQDSIMSVLLAHEQQKAKPAATVHTVDSSDDESMPTIIDTVPAPSAASHISIKADFDATGTIKHYPRTIKHQIDHTEIKMYRLFIFLVTQTTSSCWTVMMTMMTKCPW